MSEPFLIGWVEIGRALYLNTKTANKKKAYLLDQGLIFYRSLRMPGESKPRKIIFCY